MYTQLVFGSCNWDVLAMLIYCSMHMQAAITERCIRYHDDWHNSVTEMANHVPRSALVMCHIQED